jgi:hypothetical protein
MPLHTPRFMLPASVYEDLTHDYKVLILQQEIHQGHVAVGDTLDTLLRQSRDCCNGGHMHTTVPYQRLRLNLMMGTVCHPQRVCLGDGLILTCMPVHTTCKYSTEAAIEATTEACVPCILVKIYRLFAPCSVEKRKRVPS